MGTSRTRWVALLRGVNVGGITVRSADLAALFRELGFGAVRTVLASGNVVFDSDSDSQSERAGDRDRERAELKSQIEAALAERFGYDAWIVLLTQAELAAAVAAYPFERDDELSHPYLLFGSDRSVLDELWAAIGQPDPAIEAVARGEGVLYWRVLRGSSTDTPVAKLFARSRYKASTTNRNLRTVEKLLEA